MKFSADVRRAVLTVMGAIALVVMAFMQAGAPVFAQGPGPNTGAAQTKPVVPEVKPLTPEEKSTLENKVLKMELAAQALSPEALGKAFAEMMTAKQQAYQALTQDLNAYTTEIQKTAPDTVLNRDPKTGEFSRVKK